MNICSYIKLCIDRTIAERGYKQLFGLSVIVVVVFCVLWGVSYGVTFEEHAEKGQEMERLLRMVTLFIDPGAIENLDKTSHVFGIIVSFLGIVFMTGLFISVLTNALDVRGDRFRNGEINYKLCNHVIIIGVDDLVPSLVDQLCKSEKFKNAYILLQSTQETEEVKSRIHNVLERKYEHRVIFYRGKRNSKEDLMKLDVNKAKSVFVIGESGEEDRDSMNLEAMGLIAELCGKGNRLKPLPVAVQFEYQTTFSAFQVANLAEQWCGQIDFYPFNFYELWAKKVFVSHSYIHNNERIDYPLLDREPITYDSEKTVHLIILGMSHMGVAMGTFAAHLLHFPNFCRDHSKKSRITFIDARADSEMNSFRNRYRSLFEISSTLYKDYSKTDISEEIIPPTYFSGKDADFLDVEFEFIKGKVESSAIQAYLQEAAMDDCCLTSIIVCLKKPSQNMEVGLSLPSEVYDKSIPVFIHLKPSEALLTMLNRSVKEGYSKYSNLYPFGMLDNCYDLDYDKLELAQWINYSYALPTEKDEPSLLWRRLSTALQWSNLYMAYSKDFKLRSFQNRNGEVSDLEVERLCMVEHNRWCMEKLLLGFRKPHKEEQKIINRGGMVGDGENYIQIVQWYKNRFVHKDLVPNEQLEKESIMHDRDVIIGMLNYNKNTEP